MRPGLLRFNYRPLRTDTFNEKTFLRQEIGALAAGKQDRLWNFALTFVHEQGEHFTEFATEEFLTEIAYQVPGLDRSQWRHDREDPLLSRQVVLSVHSAHGKKLRYTPSFLIDFSNAKIDQRPGVVDPASLRKRIASTLRRDIESLRAEASEDVPTLGAFG